MMADDGGGGGDDDDVEADDDADEDDNFVFPNVPVGLGVVALHRGAYAVDRNCGLEAMTIDRNCGREAMTLWCPKRRDVAKAAICLIENED